jgi:hypothetical protein
MPTAGRWSLIGVTVALACGAFAQEPAPQTIEQRIAALEAGLATLDTRLGLEAARPRDGAPPSDAALAARIAGLERALERLTADVQRIERLADGAARAASAAERMAVAAQQAARDASLRAR